MKTVHAKDVQRALRDLAQPRKVPTLQRFFKTGPGEYGEGDVFLGVSVPAQRRVAHEHRSIAWREAILLLKSPTHEDRLTSLFLLVDAYTRADPKDRVAIAKAYLKHAKRVNNWDLVDSSAPQILGAHLLDKNRSVLTKLAKSKNLWERRIAMISTYAFIQNGEHADTFAIAELLLRDEHDLIHKATGWMLREVGKRVDAKHLRMFLKTHARTMPRTALRYAIEHFPRSERALWLHPPNTRERSGDRYAG